MRVLGAISLLGALLLGGCDAVYNDEAGTETPAPRGETSPQAALPVPPVAPALSGGTTVVVQAGQTLYAISREQNVPVRTLIDANNLQPPYVLKVGQTIVVPKVRQYQVQPGDTLYAVARRTDVEAATLARLNHLEPPYTLKAGLRLTLPPTAEPEAPPPITSGGIVAQALPPPSVKPAPASPPPPAAKPAPPPVAKSASTPLPAPAPSAPSIEETAPSAPQAAAVSPPVPLAPPVAPSPSVAMAPPAETKQPPPAKPVTAQPAGTVAAAPVAPAATAPPAPAAPAPPVPVVPAPTAPAASDSPTEVAATAIGHRPPTAPLFFWPVRGRIVSAFGPAAGGTYNDGINIAAHEGAEIDATESGMVAYVGEMAGYGNLLLIKHADGWVSAYGHISAFTVQKGDHVKRGEPVAKVGSTGGVGSPQLHFELRQGRTAIDPLDHLPPLGNVSG